MNFKVGVLTTHRAINYGALLQAYALHKKIGAFEGVECEIIDYVPDKKNYGRRISYKLNSLKDVIYSTILFLNFNYRSRHKNKVLSFDSFVKAKMNLSTNHFRNLGDFDQKLNRYNALVCGSDQIWNLNIINDPVFFLDFPGLNNNTKRVAYAPSITEIMSEKQIEVIKSRILGFHRLSLREEQSVDLYSKKLNVKISKVLDPVFLIHNEDWNKIAEKPTMVEKPFILSYGLVSDPLFKKGVSFVKNKYKGLNHVDIQVRPFNKYDANICTNQFTPENFIWLFKNAEFICTSSFHGTCFSIIFNKKFLTIPSKDRSLRIDNILGIAGLENRRILNVDQLTENLFTDLNYVKVNSNLKIKREESEMYLKKAFNIEG